MPIGRMTLSTGKDADAPAARSPASSEARKKFAYLK